jgi:peptidoglycan/LPS O-acetylase OafA/YrhL
MRATPNVHYMPALDGLRTVAVALVLIHHLTYTRLPGGRIGVDIFFVLSGFLITGILLREKDTQGRIDLASFYMRRLLRLMPALAIVVAFSFLFGLFFRNPAENNLGSSIFAITYLMDFVRAFSRYSEISPVAHTWSLSVEEHFYLVWPLMLGLISTLSRSRRPAAIAGVCLIFAGWRAYLAYSGASFDRVYYAFDTRFDELLAGCALACLMTSDLFAARLLWMRSLWPIAFFGLLLISVRGDWVEEYRVAAAFLPVIVSLLSCVIIAELASHPTGIAAKVASIRPMVYLGRISYGIYLWHYPLLLDVRRFSSSKTLALLAVIISIAVAALSYHYAEQPILQLKRKMKRGQDVGNRDAAMGFGSDEGASPVVTG